MNNRGFTLIEIALVIVTIAILAAVAVPQFSRYWAGIKTGNAAMSIASDIRFAQNRATTTQQRSQVNFVATGYTIRACAIADYASSTCNCGGAGWNNVKVVDFTAPTSEFSGVTIATVPTHCIEFDSLGRPYYNTDCDNPALPCPSTQIIPQFNVQYSGSTRTISVATQTGMVSY